MVKLTLIFSDIEAGGGTNTDDFVEGRLLYETIRNNFAYVKKYQTDLVLNGDILDLMKCDYKGEYPRHITEKVSLWKLERVYQTHPGFFKVLKEFLKVRKDARIVYVLGNHDYDLIYPKVQEAFVQFIVGKDEKLGKRILFPGFEFSDGLVHVEHGSQFDKFFSIDPDAFVYYSKHHFVGEPFLLLPWGYNALFDFYIHLKEKYPIIERLLPRDELLTALPSRLRLRLMWGTVWYMLKSFFYLQFKEWDDVLFRFHPREFYKYFLSFFKKEYTLVILWRAKNLLRKSKFKVLSVGHNHISGVHTEGNKTILNTGPWRDEYHYVSNRKAFVPKDKSYGWILHEEKKIKEVRLVTVPTEQKEITKEALRKILGY